MIKNLLNADEEPPPGTKVVIEETIVNAPAESLSAERATEGETSENPPVFEDIAISDDAQILTQTAGNVPETAPLDERAESIETLMTDIENLEPEELEILERQIEGLPEAENLIEPVSDAQIGTPPETAEIAPTFYDASGTPVFLPEMSEQKAENATEPAIFQTDYKPPSTAETIRGSGLAWSAGIVLFGSVVFMMIFGWFADLLFGSSPWGILVGIVLGGLIGIVQLFRISSQIYKK